jgi:hypothetical protein
VTLQNRNLLAAYQSHLAYWKERLQTVDPSDTAKLEQIRSFIAHYERQLADIKRQDGRTG